MLTFYDKVKTASSYIGTSFFNTESIGIIARGPSNLCVNKCYDKFNHCFLAGEFNNTLRYIGNAILGKNIVLCSMKPERYRTSPENCRRYNINNIQVSVKSDTKEFSEIKKKYPDLKVVGYTNDHSILKQKFFGNNVIYSTGIAAIFHALYFNPKNIYIIGMDFYDGKQGLHSVEENMDMKDDKTAYLSAIGLRSGMIENLNIMCDLSPHVDFHLFTTFRGIISRRNLEINYV